MSPDLPRFRRGWLYLGFFLLVALPLPTEVSDGVRRVTTVVIGLVLLAFVVDAGIWSSRVGRLRVQHLLDQRLNDGEEPERLRKLESRSKLLLYLLPVGMLLVFLVLFFLGLLLGEQQG